MTAYAAGGARRWRCQTLEVSLLATLPSAVVAAQALAVQGRYLRIIVSPSLYRLSTDPR